MYIDAERVAVEQARDCVAAYEDYLERLGVLDEERRAEVKQEALAVMRAGIQEAEDEPAGDPELVFAHAYADPPAANARDLDDLRRVHGR